CARTGADRARGRLLRLAQALSECRLLFGPDLPGDGLSDRLLHGAVRARPAAGLARAVGGDALRPRAEDRAATADLHRPRRARFRSARTALGVGTISWWLSPHPDWEPGEDWPEEVPVVRYETADEVVLIDPFLPPDGAFNPGGKPVRVLLTQRAHYR